MAVPLQSELASPDASLSVTPRRITVARAVFALVWAAGLVIALGGKIPSTSADVPTGAALFLASYPLIDVVASLFGSTLADARVLRINAAISAAAVVAVGIAAFGSDAGSTLAAFGVWAAVSGLIQLGVAIHRRRTQGRQLPMIVSGAVSTVAGAMFIAASGNDTAHFANLAGYMVAGAVLFLLFAWRDGATPATAR
jgi:uncharacterized membrane protein HdeD (DUF308 family)